jgi:hypothetical protein
LETVFGEAEIADVMVGGSPRAIDGQVVFTLVPRYDRYVGKVTVAEPLNDLSFEADGAIPQGDEFAAMLVLGLDCPGGAIPRKSQLILCAEAHSAQDDLFIQANIHPHLGLLIASGLFDMEDAVQPGAKHGLEASVIGTRSKE